jgi:hypothetical protein
VVDGSVCAARAAIEASASPKADGCYEFWLNRYQTLISGVFAVLAALGSIYFLRRQIAVSEAQEAMRLKRRNAAARAMLQLSLNTICAYAKRSAESLEEMMDSLPPHLVGHWTGTPAPLSLPDSAIEQIRGLIETVDVEQINAFSTIIGKIQVHEARREPLYTAEGVSRPNLRN